jgi:nicotinate-nucleotide adenylyltransferase
MNPTNRVGIFGGTFDPIHIGHLAAMQEAAFELDLDRVLFVPNRLPPHKFDRPVTRFQDRVAMVRLAIASNTSFALDSSEIDREGPSYTLDTLRYITKRFGSGVAVVFILGFDALLDLPTWHEPDTLLAEFDLVVMDRPERDEMTIDREPLWLELETRFPSIRARVRTVHVPQLAIAAADIRARVATGRPIRYLVPEAVEDYIRERGLYRQ